MPDLIRFRIRHLQQTIADHVEAHLTALGWTADPAPWGIAPIQFREVEPEHAPKVEPTIVSTVVEDEGNRAEGQLGGGLYSFNYNVFVDVFAEKPSIALSIASDVRDCLTGVLQLKDFSGPTPVVVPNAWIEFEFVELTKGPAAGDMKAAWKMVHATVTLEYTP